MTEYVPEIISLWPKLIKEEDTYEQVVTTAFSFNSARHLRELHLKEKSMVWLAMGCGWREQEVKVTS
jgi:hypothetical protein